MDIYCTISQYHKRLKRLMELYRILHILAVQILPGDKSALFSMLVALRYSKLLLHSNIFTLTAYW